MNKFVVRLVQHYTYIDNIAAINRLVLKSQNKRVITKTLVKYKLIFLPGIEYRN